MQKKTKIAALVAIIMTGTLGISTAYAEITCPQNSVPQKFSCILDALNDHEQRIQNLEDRTSVTVQGGSSSGLSLLSAQTCSLLDDKGTPDEIRDDVFDGWCPVGDHFNYFIEDARATENSAVFINIQNPLAYTEGVIDCRVSRTGTVTFQAGTVTGFELECQGNAATATMNLIYVIFS